MPIYNMSRQFKKLTLQYSFLKLEKEDIEEISFKGATELEKAYREKYGNNIQNKTEIPDPKLEEPEESEESEESEIPIDEEKNKDLKKLYRKIAITTHPDKTGSKDCNDLFNKAARAYKSNDLAQLLDIAGSLNIEIIELSRESLLLLEENIKTLTEDINILKDNTAWYWSNAKNEEEKEAILKFIYNYRNGDKK